MRGGSRGCFSITDTKHLTNAKKKGGLYPDSVNKGRTLPGGEGLAESTVPGVWLGFLTSRQNRERRRKWWRSAFPFHASGDPSRRLLPPTFKMALPALV